MAQPWKVLETVATPDGELQLRQRGERDFLITFGGLVLMNSTANRSELALGSLACAALHQVEAPRVLVGGLGMGCTLRAVLDSLPGTARVVVAELNPVVLQWCRGPLAPLTGAAVEDPRVEVRVADVAQVISSLAQGGEQLDAVVFDLYTGPHARTAAVHDPLYGSRAIERTRSILKPGGMFAVWGENPDAAFTDRLRKAGFSVTIHRPGRGGLRHVVYLARR
ncbi:MAG TPA: spermidine synthase [Verrucomicrobiae bacterium]|nr:spermidine synthase [Verrucomicrobiae bacterium]